MIESKYKEAIPLILFCLLAILILSVTTFNIGAPKAKADTANTSVEVGNASPTIVVSLNGGEDIGLIEDTWTSVTTTITVTDPNGCDTIDSVTSTLWWTPYVVASSTSCGYDAEICYPSDGVDIAAQSCTVTLAGDDADLCGVSPDTTADYDCAFHVWYIATSTDNDTSYLWSVAATATDEANAFATASNSSETIELTGLAALDVEATVAFGPLSAAADTGVTNQEQTVSSTGNIPIDLTLEAAGDADEHEYMCTSYPACDTYKIGVWMEEYSLSSGFSWDTGTDLRGTDSPAVIQVVLEKNTATSTNGSFQTDIIYWGMGIPVGQEAGSYTGQNSYTAQAD